MNILGSLWISAAKFLSLWPCCYVDAQESVGSSPAPEVFFFFFARYISQPVSEQRALLCGRPDSWHPWPVMGDTRHFGFYDRPWTRLRRGASYENPPESDAIGQAWPRIHSGTLPHWGENCKKKNPLWPAIRFSFFFFLMCSEVLWRLLLKTCDLTPDCIFFCDVKLWCKKCRYGLKAAILSDT